jgi:hypothetical protein
MTEIINKKRVLDLEAGVQSTAIFLMSMDGDIEPFDVAIFADTQEEPASVYRHLDWLDSLGGPPILIVTAGKLGDALENAGADEGKRHTSIPAYTKNPDGTRGLIRRQCTGDYKVQPIELAIREQVFSVGKGKPLSKNSLCVQVMGLSFDEPKRVIRVKQRFLSKPKTWCVEFPLWELEMTRLDCVRYLEKRVPHPVPRSACVFCPFKKDDEWKWLKEHDPEGWERAVQIDAMCRDGKGLIGQRFLHSSLVPLPLVDFKTKDERTGQMNLGFIDECEGYCGN